jgi:hypothetical protein
MKALGEWIRDVNNLRNEDKRAFYGFFISFSILELILFVILTVRIYSNVKINLFYTPAIAQVVSIERLNDNNFIYRLEIHTLENKYASELTTDALFQINQFVEIRYSGDDFDRVYYEYFGLGDFIGFVVFISVGVVLGKAYAAPESVLPYLSGGN